LRVGDRRIPVADTEKSLSKAVGKRLASATPQTMVEKSGGSTTSYFDGQSVSHDDLREIRALRASGGTVAQLVHYKALLNFGEGADIHVENNTETEQVVDGERMTLQEWFEANFQELDKQVLEFGEDALFYPYAIGEIQETVTGEFKRALPAEPYTMLPITDESGAIQSWEQRITQDGGSQKTRRFPSDEMWSIVVNKESARDETGISEVLRNKDEIDAYKSNEDAINQAIDLHGYPQRHIKVGREDGTPVSDDDLRRVRTVFDPRTSDSNTAYFTGQDVDVETLEAENFDYSAIHEMSMRSLTTALGLPVEAGNVGSDGLGSGKPAELRMALLKLSLKATQRTFASQFVSEIFGRSLRSTHRSTIHIRCICISATRLKIWQKSPT
jgi:hypothetical protein